MTEEERLDSAFQAIKTHVKITGLLPEKHRQVFKSLSEEIQMFAGMGNSEVFDC